LKAKQYWVICAAIGLTAAIYVFGTTKFPAKSFVQETKQVNIESLLNEARPKLPAPQRKTEQDLYTALAASRNTNDSITAAAALMRFWGNDINNDDIATWYMFQKAKLENSEKKSHLCSRFHFGEYYSRRREYNVGRMENGFGPGAFYSCPGKKPGKRFLNNRSWRFLHLRQRE